MSKRTLALFLPLVVWLSSGCQPLQAIDGTRTIEGSYDAETRYDMSTFAGLFASIAPQWRQPDALIQSQILGRVESEYGSTIASTFNTLYGAQLQTDIKDYLASEAPPWIMQIGPKMDEVDAQMKTVDLQNTMLLAELETGEVKATQLWNGIAVFDDPNCPDSDAITCDQLELNSQELLDSEYPVEVISSDFTALQDGENLALNAHSLDFNYGRLGLYMLTNQILPDDPTEGIGLRDVAMAAINCRGLAGRLAGDDGVYGVEVAGVNVGLSLDDLIGNCEEGVVGQVNGFVDQFDVPLGMNLQGAARAVDVNFDGRVDQLTGGQVDGDMQVQLLGGQSTQGPVSGKFIGFRVGDLP